MAQSQPRTPRAAKPAESPTADPIEADDEPKLDPIEDDEELNPECVPPWTESKISATQRLKFEGQWDEASIYRDLRLYAWRRAGHGPISKEYAWREMIAMFPPLKTKPPPPPPPAAAVAEVSRETLDRLAAVKLDWERDVEWAFCRLDHPATVIDDAPSLAAWTILKFGRDEPQSLFRIVSGMMTNKAKSKASENGDQPGPPSGPPSGPPTDPALADLQKMMAKHGLGRN